jgi:serine/threonine-protein kinase
MDRIGRYKIIRELGRGAMGVVYHAIDPNIGRPVAIKTINLGAVLKPDEQERMRERLFREARSAGILSHPGIVTIYDVEQQGDLAYIAMEYVDGPTLDQVLSEPQPLAPERMFGILGQTAVALDYAHGKGIVHRDVKPANIMIAGDGTAKITDFGIAKITASEQFTMTGSIVGTPHYMSPEQVQGQPVDGRSDQFSLAVIAFEMLTGEKPYTGEHLTTVVYKIVAEEPPAPHRINSTLSSAIEAVVRKSLSKKPDGRYATCQEFTDSLEKACAATKGWRSLPRGGSLNAPTVADKRLDPPALPPSRRRRGETTATGTTERAPQRKGGFLPFLAAILMAAALLAIVALEVKVPWLGVSRSPDQPAAQAEPPKPQAPAAIPAAPVAAPVAAETKSTAVPPGEVAAEPSAAGNPPAKEEKPPEPAAAAQAPQSGARGKTPGRGRTAASSAPPRSSSAPARASAPPARVPSAPARIFASPQPVQVVSSPSGAIATMDGQADTACTTPCTLEAAPGRHTVELRKAGFDVERREVEVTSSALELPAVVLRSVQGALMVTSDPPGAAVLVNGKRDPQITPAKIWLVPGSYAITVEWKDGKQATRTVLIKDGINYQKFLVGQ